MKILRRCFFLFGLISASVALLRAQGQGPGLNGPPDQIEARPPIHFRPFISPSPSGYAPAQMRHAYGFDQITGNGAGQIIAIVDAYGSPTIQNDLNVFCSTYGLPTVTVEVYYPQGKVRQINSGWALETSLDVEWAHAIAPGARIALVVAKSASLTNLLGAVNYAVNLGAKQVSMSWGASEFSSESSYDSYFAHAGVTFLASSGDSGAGVIWPAASPNVTAVGGTSLVLDGSGNVSSETAWSGSGGGVSSYETLPSYQTGWLAAAGRGVPDVSYNADPNTGVPVYLSDYNNTKGWFTVGGTSAGAPQWAALLALTNASRSSSVSSSDPALYATATANYAANFRDITVGNNGAYSASVNYDLVTGLGSPLANQLVPSLISY